MSNGSFTLATFVSETIGDSDTWLYLAFHLGRCDIDRIISVSVALPKVAKASASVLPLFVIVAGIVTLPSPM